METITMKKTILAEVHAQMNELSKQADPVTGDLRSMSARIFQHIKDKDIQNVLDLCEQLLDTRRWELGVLAYDWAYRMKKHYRAETFTTFERWLKKYVSGWGDCDDFCTHAFGEVLSQNTDLFGRVLAWTKHPDFWVRRAAAVILIRPIKKGKWQELAPFTIADRLMHDEHHLVLKGYGWMLKVLSTLRPDDVYNYLIKNREQMPRVSFRYAIEKFDEKRKAILMAK